MFGEHALLSVRDISAQPSIGARGQTFHEPGPRCLRHHDTVCTPDNLCAPAATAVRLLTNGGRALISHLVSCVSLLLFVFVRSFGARFSQFIRSKCLGVSCLRSSFSLCCRFKRGDKIGAARAPNAAARPSLLPQPVAAHKGRLRPIGI